MRLAAASGGEGRQMRYELKTAIIRSGIAQYELASRIHISETRLSRIVAGRIQPTHEECRRLAKLLRVSEDQICAVTK